MSRDITAPNRAERSRGLGGRRADFECRGYSEGMASAHIEIRRGIPMSADPAADASEVCAVHEVPEEHREAFEAAYVAGYREGNGL